MKPISLFSLRAAAAASLATAVLVSLLAGPTPPAIAQANATAVPLTASELRDALRDPARNNAQLAAAVRAWFGEEALKSGPRPKVENVPGRFAVAFALEAPGLNANETPEVVAEDGTFSLRLQRIANTEVYAGVAYRPEGLACRYTYLVKGKKRGMNQIEDYPRNLEEIVNPNIPHGKTTQMPPFHSKIFDGTSRDWWVYVPAQYSAENPPAVMVFQDGGGAKNWAPTMLDNLIARGDVPPMVGIFINPGTFDANKRSNRSFEYDSLGDRYPRFLLEEILPEVEKTVKLTHDPDKRGIFGVSSGGICAFTVAWEKPDEFRKVFTVVGSFTNLQGGPTGTAGGNTYPAIIRHGAGWSHEGKPKPIRMFQTDGANDLDNAAGSWPLSNQQIDRALTYGGYDHKFVFGNGFHGDRFGRYHFPDGMRWLWRKPDAAPAAK